MPSVIFGIVLLAVVLTVAVAAMRDARLAKAFENPRAIKQSRDLWDGFPRDSR